MTVTKVRPSYLMNLTADKFGTYRKKTTILAIQINEPFEVDTLEGTMKGNPGDYLAQGAKGEWYPIKPDVFEATYVEVKEEA